MKRTLCVMAIASVLLAGCNGGGDRQAGGGSASQASGDQSATQAGGAEVRSPFKVSAQETAGLVERGEAVLVDVREERELRGGMAAPAIWIPTSEIGRDGPAWRAFVEAQPKDRTLVFYCAVGGRSQYAATMLAEKGYRTANLGGFSEWQRAGLPVKVPDNPEMGR